MLLVARCKLLLSCNLFAHSGLVYHCLRHHFCNRYPKPLYLAPWFLWARLAFASAHFESCWKAPSTLVIFGLYFWVFLSTSSSSASSRLFPLSLCLPLRYRRHSKHPTLWTVLANVHWCPFCTKEVCICDRIAGDNTDFHTDSNRARCSLSSKGRFFFSTCALDALQQHLSLEGYGQWSENEASFPPERSLDDQVCSLDFAAWVSVQFDSQVACWMVNTYFGLYFPLFFMSLAPFRLDWLDWWACHSLPSPMSIEGNTWYETHLVFHISHVLLEHVWAFPKVVGWTRGCHNTTIPLGQALPHPMGLQPEGLGNLGSQPRWSRPVGQSTGLKPPELYLQGHVSMRQGWKKNNC